MTSWSVFAPFVQAPGSEVLVLHSCFVPGSGKEPPPPPPQQKKRMQSIAPSPGWERVALHLALNNSASFLCLWCLILWCTSVHLFNPALKALNTCAYRVTSALWYANSRLVKNNLCSSSCLIPIFRSICFIPESIAAISHAEPTRYSVELWKIAYLAVGSQLPA